MTQIIVYSIGIIALSMGITVMARQRRVAQAVVRQAGSGKSHVVR